MEKEEKNTNDRLDVLQNMEPTSDAIEEYCLLASSLRRFLPQQKPPQPFHRQFWQLRGLIWLAAISLCANSLFFTPIFVGSPDTAVVSAAMLLGSACSLGLALWGSTYQE